MPKYAQIVNMLFPPSVRLEYGSSGLKVWLAHALVQRRVRAVRGREGGVVKEREERLEWMQ